MTLKSELIEALKLAILKAWAPQCTDCTPDYPAGCGCAQDAAEAALDTYSAFLAERGLKVVGREATRHQIKVMKGAVKRYNKSLGHGESASSEAFPTIYYESGVVAAPDLFAEAPDAR